MHGRDDRAETEGGQPGEDPVVPAVRPAAGEHANAEPAALDAESVPVDRHAIEPDAAAAVKAEPAINADAEPTTLHAESVSVDRYAVDPDSAFARADSQTGPDTQPTSPGTDAETSPNAETACADAALGDTGSGQHVRAQAGRGLQLQPFADAVHDRSEAR